MRTAVGHMQRFIVDAGGLVVALVLPLWFNPWAKLPFEPAKLALFRNTTAIMAAGAAIAWILQARPRSYTAGTTVWTSLHEWGDKNPLALPVLVYMFVYVFATVTAVAPRISLWGPSDSPQGTITVLCTVVFFMLVSSGLQTRTQFDRVGTALILGSVPVAIYGLSQFLGLDPLYWITNSVSPVFSTMGRSNFLGAYLAMIVPFTLSHIASASELGSRLRYALVLALQVSCLWLTLARAAWLSLLGGVLIFLGLLAQRRRSQVLCGIAVVVLPAGVWLYTAMNVTALPRWNTPESDIRLGQEMPFGELRVASVNARLTIWQTTLGLVRSRWLLGYGPQQFVGVFAAHYPPELARFEGLDVIVDDPHNLFLDQLMAAGVVGLSALLGVIVGFYRLAFSAFRRCRDRQVEGALAALMGSVTAFIIQAQFNPDAIVLSAFFWLVMALGSIAARWIP